MICLHLAVGELRPAGHRGVGQADADHAAQVLVGGQHPAGRGAELVLAGGEVARRRLDPARRVPLAVALHAVALGAVLVVERLPVLRR